MQNTRSICEEARCEDFDRVKFFNGQLLAADDFDLQTEYFRKQNKQHNVYLHGDGVIQGLRVRAAHPAGWQVIVEKGVAVDCGGNEMHVRSDQVVNLEEIAGSVSSPTVDREFVICIKYKEEEGCPVPGTGSGDFCGGARYENSRIKDGYSLEVYEKKRFLELVPCLQLLATTPLFSLFKKKIDTDLTMDIRKASGIHTTMQQAYAVGNLGLVGQLMGQYLTIQRSCEETLQRKMTDLTLEPMPSCTEPHCVPIASVTVKPTDTAITKGMIDLYIRKVAVSTGLLFDLLVSSICALQKTDVRIVPSYRNLSTAQNPVFHSIAYNSGAGAEATTCEFFASVKNAKNKEVTWSVIPQSGVSVGTIDNNGIYTKPTGDTIPESVVIKAVSKEDETAYDTATVKLK
jgi:hypothetical protein